MGIMDEIKDGIYQNKKLLEKALNDDVEPRNWHDSVTLDSTAEARYNVYKNLGDQGGRYLRIKVSKQCTISLSLAGVGQREKFEEGLKANRIGKFRFKAPMVLTDFYITPSIADTVVTWWVSTIEMPADLEDDMTHLDGDTFETVSDRAVLIAGEDGTNIRTIQVNSSGKIKLADIDNNQNFGIRVGGFLPQTEELGDAIFVDGDVTASGAGTSWPTALKTIAEGDALTTAWAGDYVFIAKSSSDYDENSSVNGVTINEDATHWIFMDRGANVVVNSNASAVYCFYVRAGSCEISGVYINEASTTVEGIYADTSCTFLYIHHCYFRPTMENGIHLANVYYGLIEWNTFLAITNDGIEATAATTHCIIQHNDFFRIGDNAIHLNGDSVDFNTVKWNDINGEGGITDYGITITLGDKNFIDWNSMGELGTWPVFNSGSNNYFGPNNSADSGSGSYNRTVANGTSLIATNVTNIDLWASGKYEFQWDLSAMVSAGEGGNVDCFIYSKVISTFIRRDMDRMVIGTDVLHPTCEKSFVGGDAQLQEGLQCSVVVTTNRLVGWRLIKC